MTNKTSNNYINRKKFSTTLDKDLLPYLDDLYQKTRIPKARLLDEAIIDLLDKYKIEREKK